MSPGVDLTERRIDSETVFHGVLLDVRRDRVRLPGGGEGVREWIRHPGAVVVLPLFDDGAVLLERQFRYPHGRAFVELPAGKLDPGEPHEATARRELAEETGYTAIEWRRLATIHPCIAYSDETIELWLARGLVAGEARPDAGEFIDTFRLPLAEALDQVRDGRITDTKTVTALLWLRCFGV